MEINNLQETVTSATVFRDGYVIRDEFLFRSVTSPGNVYDALILRSPENAQCSCPLISEFSEKTLEEHIAFINENKLEKAFVIAENLDFIVQCPTLKHVSVVPSDNVGNGFDYSLLYKLPELLSVSCPTEYGKRFQYTTTVDYSKFPKIESIFVTKKGCLNYNKIDTLKNLGLSHYGGTDLTDAFCSKVLDTMTIIQSKVQSLNGIQNSENMQCLYLYYNRSLQDISQLRHVKKTLRALRIENCPKIEDFSVLGELEQLELLEICGSNTLPNLDFLKTMKNLKTFVFDVNVEDGDLTPCLGLSYATCIRSRRHYNVKDADLPRNQYFRGNENIDPWRRKQ